MTSAIGKINREENKIEVQGQMNTAEFFCLGADGVVSSPRISLPEYFKDYESKLSAEITENPEERQKHLQMRPLTRFEKIPGAGYISIIFGFTHVVTGQLFVYQDEASPTVASISSSEPSNRGTRRAKEKSSKKGKGEQTSPTQQ